MDTLTPDLQKPADDGNADENLKLQQQQKAATAVPSGSDPAPIPAPPPLPSTSPAPAPAATAAPAMPAPPPPPSSGALFGGDTAKINEYWAKQGVQIAPSALGVAATGVGANGVNTYNDAEVAAAQAKLAGGNNADVSAMLAQLRQPGGANNDVAARSAPIDAANDATRASTIAATIAGGGGASTNVAPIEQGPQLTLPGGAETPPASAPNVATDTTSGVAAQLGTRMPPIDTSQGLAAQVSARAPLSAPAGSASDVGAPSSGVAQKIGSAVPLASSTSAAPFTANDVGIGSTILPNADPRLSNTQGMVDAAAQNLASVDRFKLAGDRFDTEAARTDPAYKLALRRATQSAAGAGRIGSGMLRTSYGDLGNQRALELDSLRKGFMQDALQGTISDSFNKFGALAGLENQQFGQGQATRGELRGERGYQGSLEEQAFQRAIGQYDKEQSDVRDRFARGTTLAGVGESGNPANYYSAMAAQLGVDPSVIMALAGSLGKSSVGSTGPSIPQYPTFPNATPPIVPKTPASPVPYPYE